MQQRQSPYLPMPKLTFIGRECDGLMLCETYEDKETVELKVLAKQVLKKLQRERDIGALDTKLGHTFYYKIVDGVVFLTCAESGYSKKLAFAFLDEVIGGFQEELKKTFGTGESVNYRSKVETIERPYFFLKFDRFIKKKRLQYMNPSRDMMELHQELEEVKNIMKQNIDILLERDKTLGEIEDMSGKLSSESKLFADKAHKLNFSMWLRKWGLCLAIVLVLSCGLYYRFIL